MSAAHNLGVSNGRLVAVALFVMTLGLSIGGALHLA